MRDCKIQQARGLRPLLTRGLRLTAFAISILAQAHGAANAVEARAQRVLAIGGAVTEIIYALGQQDRLIGRDSTSTYPPEATALPDVGYIRALSPEGVLSVRPDLILARENNGPPEAVEVLKSTGIRWVDVPDNFTLEGIDDNITIIAAELGVAEKGEELKKKVAAEIAHARDRLASVTDRHRVLFLLSLEDDKIRTAGVNTAASGIIELAGGETAITAFEGYKQISNEAAIKAAPDIILMMNGRGAAAEHAAMDERIRAHPALSTTPAVKAGRIIRMDGLLLLGFGPRTGAAISELAEAFYGDEH